PRSRHALLLAAFPRSTDIPLPPARAEAHVGAHHSSAHHGDRHGAHAHRLRDGASRTARRPDALLARQIEQRGTEPDPRTGFTDPAARLSLTARAPPP